MDELEKFSVLRNLNSTPSCFSQLIHLYEKYKVESNKKIFIDFSQIQFLDANMTAFFDAVIYQLKLDCGHEFYLDFQDIKKRFDIFIRNGFLSDSEGQFSPIGHKGSEVRLTRFLSDQDECFYAYLDKQLFDHQAFKNNSSIKDDLINHFFEVFVNIQLHAQTDHPVFACGQYFPYHKSLKFTLVDLGVGFLEPISKFTRQKITEADKAIIWALDGNTTKIDQPGGLGLSRIKMYCDKNKHSFQIITDGYCWGNNLGLLNLKKLSHFPGTTITLEFNCK